MSEEKMSWPALPYNDWAETETCSALHLWTQIVGKYRLARTPWVNHSWHATCETARSDDENGARRQVVHHLDF
jgi:hypothetical protein